MVRRPSTATFVVSHLEPRYGMEGAAADLVTRLSEKRDVDVVVVGGDVSGQIGRARVRELHGRTTGVQRLLNVFRLRAMKRAPGPVVLVGVWVALPWLLANLGRRTAGPVIIWEHSFTATRVASGARFRLLWAAARLLYRRADLIVAPGPACANLLDDAFPEVPVLTIPNVSSCPEVVDVGARDRAGVLVVGRLERVKRGDLALRAFAQSSSTSLHLTILGDGVEREGLERLAEALGVSSRVSFEGNRSRTEVLEWMRRSAVLLHAAEAETFGLVYLEAASCELPVVSAPHAAARDLVPAATPGLVAESDDPAALADALDAALQADRDTWDWKASRDVRERRFDQRSIVDLWGKALEAGA